MKILIIKRDKIGDMLLATPMFEHIKTACAHCELHVLANDYNEWVIRNNPFIDKLWVYPRTRHAGRIRFSAPFRELLITIKLRKENFDFVIAAGGVTSPRAIQRALRIRGKRTVAYSDRTNFHKLTDPLILNTSLHEVQSNINLLEAIGLKATTINLPRFSPPPTAINFAKEWLVHHNIQPYKFIVLGINSRRDKRKPTDDQIFRWSKYLYEEHGIRTVLAWQPGEANSQLYPGDDERMSDILHRLPKWVTPYPASESIFPLLGIIWNAVATVVPDGGLAHLASVSPGGVLALFADTNTSPSPINWGPFSDRGLYIEAKNRISELDDSDVLNLIELLIKNFPMPVKQQHRALRNDAPS